MKAIGDAVAFILVVALVLWLFFLFSGEPDVWDALHARAMERMK